MRYGRPSGPTRSRTGPGWRGRVRRSGTDGPPGGVFWSLGILLPAALVLGGVYCLRTDAFFLPVYKGEGFDVAGAVANGLGIIALGFAILLHSGFFLRHFPTLRKAGTVGMIIGGVTMLGGFVHAVV